MTSLRFVVLAKSRHFVALGIRSMGSNAGKNIPRVPLLINGKFVESKSEKWFDVANPATQEVIAQVPQATAAEMNAAVAAAKEAFGTWRNVTPSERQRVLFRYQHAIRENMDEIAALITKEQGKTLGDAKGDVFRGLEVVEFACGAGSKLMGETLESVGSGIDTYSYRQPLGVCAGIAPFNFPAMIPLWMYPLACVLGNTYVLKPSERVPLTSVKLMELAIQSGFPAGTVNLIHGAHDTVNFICDHPDIRAISFVGSNVAGEHIYK
jgi:malonate-semialdehyde dehydrogenase (acetylating) / methylmalonate-semialdehyde dehydrogenase